MSESGETDRSYVVLASDGDMAQDCSREEAVEWAESHLSMLETLEPEGVDHWVQINSYRPGKEWGDDEDE